MTRTPEPKMPESQIRFPWAEEDDGSIWLDGDVAERLIKALESLIQGTRQSPGWIASEFGQKVETLLHEVKPIP
jgi:hypothetical protein